jgi:Rad3-related DNA helicase
MREIQKKALEIIGEKIGRLILELPTGTGKTVIGYVYLKALEKMGMKHLFYVAPTKALVEQVKFLHSDVKIVFGRSEYPCLYYSNEKVTAEEAPCSFLSCPHRVNQETGKTESGMEPCPYLMATYEAKKGGIVVCTTAFYLYSQFLANWEKAEGVVIDEAHRIAKVVRNCLSYEITDYHLRKIVEILKGIDSETTAILEEFLKTMTEIARHKFNYKPTLLTADEIRELIRILQKIDAEKAREQLKEAIKGKKIDTRSQREFLKKIEIILRDIRRYLTSLGYSLPTEDRDPLNYICAFCRKDLEGKEKAKYFLFIKSYYVAPIISKILPSYALAYSATIGDPDIFGYETGIKSPFYTFPSSFSDKNTRIFLPTDTPNLAVKGRSRQEPNKILRKIIKACKKFADSDIRSLVVVVSEKERQKFLNFSQEAKLEVLSYGNGFKAKEVVANFKNGQGRVLVGTLANYGDGIDLPDGLSPVIFFLRPGYPSPDDPIVKFEEKRYGAKRWELWTYRVMIEALQVRGRNIRGARDKGVTFFVSQQFRRFLYPKLPDWLKSSYRNELSFDQCVKETIKLLK